MGKFIQDFKEFALKGNVIDMAVGVIVGGAFGKIVSSLVNDIIMPLVSVIITSGDGSGAGAASSTFFSLRMNFTV